MKELLTDDYLMVALTMGVYYASTRLQRRCGGNILLNPIFISIVVLIAILLIVGIPYESYAGAADIIMWWMQPAIVAMAWPLYKHWDAIRREALPIIAAELIGGTLGVVSVTLILKWMGGSDIVIASMAAKSVTMPIAMAVTDQLGGMMSITSIVVIFTGLLGALTGGLILPRIGVTSTSSRGLAIGTASHAVGTASCYAVSDHMGAYSTIAMILNGVITAMIAPWLLQIMGFC